MTLRVKLLHINAKIPTYATAGSAGADLYSVQETVLEPGIAQLISTGVAVSIPAGYEGQIRPRSGLAAKHGITVLNAPGTVDSDYRGEIKVLLINHGQNPYRVSVGDRIAQLVISKVLTPPIEEVVSLETSQRGSGGFGSTGK